MVGTLSICADSFIEELDKLLREGMEREKLTEKDLEKARGQLKKRRQKEAKKKQRKREASKKQKGDKGAILLANPSDIAALTGYTLEPTDPAADPSLLLPPLQSVQSSPEPNAHAHPHHHHHHHLQHAQPHGHGHVHDHQHTDDENHTVEH